MDLRQIQWHLDFYLQKIEMLLPEDYNLTLVVRHKKSVDADFIMTKDDTEKVINSISRLHNISLRNDKPCDHPGCASHKTHPCEGCGRQW